MSDTSLRHEAMDDVPDATLAGYYSVHDRPPAYEGSDGHPYTVSVETEHTGDLREPYVGYLVFPRWAQSGVGIVGHVETATLASGATAAEVTRQIGERTLAEVQALLEEAIARRDVDGGAEDGADGAPDRKRGSGGSPADGPRRSEGGAP